MVQYLVPKLKLSGQDLSQLYSARFILSCKSPTVNKTSILQKTALMKKIFRKFHNKNSL